MKTDINEHIAREIASIEAIANIVRVTAEKEAMGIVDPETIPQLMVDVFVHTTKILEVLDRDYQKDPNEESA